MEKIIFIFLCFLLFSSCREKVLTPYCTVITIQEEEGGCYAFVRFGKSSLSNVLKGHSELLYLEVPCKKYSPGDTLKLY